MGMPMPGQSTHNGISGSSKSPAMSLGGSGGTTIKAKPGTVAAALEEKKKAAAQAAAAAVPVPVNKETSITNEPNNTNGTIARENSNIDIHEKTSTADEGTDNEGSTKGGLTSEERVLLREKKKARLQKEQQDGHEFQDGHHEGHQDGHHEGQQDDTLGHQDGHHQDGHPQDGHPQDGHHHEEDQDGLHEDLDGGNGSDGGEGGVTENADGSKSEGPRLTRSGRRRGTSGDIPAN